MVLKNYLNFFTRKQLLLKFNFLNIFSNLSINKVFVIIPYYLFKFKLKINIINLYKLCLYLFNQRIYLNDIKFKIVFKLKFILFKHIVILYKYNYYKLLDYFFIFVLYNYFYYIKSNNYLLLFNNKLLFNNNNLHNFFKKFYRFDIFLVFKFFITLNLKCKKKYNSFFFFSFLI